MSQSEYRRFYNVTQIKIENGGKCIDCNNNDIRLLEFDHINKNKLFNIAGCSIIDYNKLKEESDKMCTIKTLKYHRIKTSKNTKLRYDKHLDTFGLKKDMH